MDFGSVRVQYCVSFTKEEFRVLSLSLARKLEDPEDIQVAADMGVKLWEGRTRLHEQEAENARYVLEQAKGLLG